MDDIRDDKLQHGNCVDSYLEVLLEVFENLPTPFAVLGIAGQLPHVPETFKSLWAKNVLSSVCLGQVHGH